MTKSLSVLAVLLSSVSVCGLTMGSSSSIGVVASEAEAKSIFGATCGKDTDEEYQICTNECGKNTEYISEDDPNGREVGGGENTCGSGDCAQEYGVLGDSCSEPS